MADEVERKVVEMRFENEQFQRNIKQTIKSLDNLSDKLEMDTASRGFDMLQKTVNKFNWGTFSQGLDMVLGKFNSWTYNIERTFKTRVADRIINATESLVKGMSFDQVSSGYNKYTEKMESIMTIMNATGKSMEEVDEYLQELMTYSDETSYSFTDMTKALATFTSSGADIENAIPMIEGIANATAHAGKGAAALQSALLNLSQSYGSGALQAIDWKSLTGYGVGTKTLKETLIEEAKALGTLNKEGKTLDGTLVTVGNFNDTLKDRWATKEVMEAAFKRYSEFFVAANEMVKNGQADTVTEAMKKLGGKFDEIAEKSFRAAQETKSFREAIDATKDAVSSGWLRVFEKIFGNFEEAKEMWTDLTERLWEMFASGFDPMLEKLDKWLDMDGRINMIAAFRNSWDALVDTIAIVKEAFRTVFPEVTGERLAEITNRIKNLTQELNLSYTYWNKNGELQTVWTKRGEKLLNVTKGIASALGIIRDAFASVGKAGIGVIKSLVPIGITLLDLIENIAKRVSDLFDTLNKNGTFDKLLKPISDMIIRFIEAITPFIQNGLDDLANFVDDLCRILTQLDTLPFFKNANKNYEKGIGLLPSIFKAFVDVIGSMFENLKNGGAEKILNDTKARLDKIGKVFLAIVDWFKNVAFPAVRDFIKELTIGKATLISYSAIFGLILLSMGRALLGIFHIVDFFENIEDSYERIKRAFRRVNMAAIVTAIGAIVLSIFMISASISNIAKVWSENRSGFWSAIATISAITLVVTGMIAAFKFLGQGAGEDIKPIGSMLLNLGISIKLIANAVAMLASINQSGIIKATLVISGLTVLVGAIGMMIENQSAWLKQEDALKNMGNMFLGFGYAIYLIARAVRKVGRLGLDEVLKGAISIGALIGVFGGIAIAMIKSVKDMEDVNMNQFTGFILAFGVSIKLIANAIKGLAKIATKENGMDAIAVSTVAMIGVIFVLINGLKKMAENGTDGEAIKKSTVTVLAMAVALSKIGKSIKDLAETEASWLKVATAAASIAGAIVAIGASFKMMNGSEEYLKVAATFVAMALALRIISDSVSGLSESMVKNPEETLTVFRGLIEAMIAIFVGIAVLSIKAKDGSLLQISLLFGVVAASTLALAAAMTILANVPWHKVLGAIVGLGAGLALITATIFALAYGLNGFSAALLPVAAVLGTIAGIMFGVAAVMNGFAHMIETVTNSLIRLNSVSDWSGLIDFIELLLDYVPKMAVSAMDTIFDAVITFIRRAGEAIRVGLDEAKKLISNFCTWFIDFGVTMFDGMIEAVADKSDSISDNLGAIFENILYYSCMHALDAFEEITDDMSERIPEIVRNLVVTFGSSIVNGIVGVIEVVGDNAKPFVEAIYNAFSNIVDAIAEYAPKFRAEFDRLAEAIGLKNTLFYKIFVGITNGPSLSNQIFDAYKGLGRNVAQGFAEGIEEDEGLIDKVIKFSLIKNPFITTKTGLEIHSPSKVYEALARYIPMGFANGIQNGEKEVTGAVDDMVDASIKAVNPNVFFAALGGLASVLQGGGGFDLRMKPVLDSASYSSAMSYLNTGASREMAVGVAASMNDMGELNMHHSFDTLVVKGVNDRQQIIDTVEFSIEEILGKIVRRQGRM